MLSLIELESVKKVIDSLNNYQILKISPLANDQDIQEAFHREALLFHPDRYYSVKDPKMSELAKSIYGKVVNAYRVLSDRAKRESYDKLMKTGLLNATTAPTAKSTSDDDVDDNEITAVRKKPTGSTVGAGARFFKLAQTAFAAKDFQSARMNIQIAMNTDSGNPEYLTLSQRIESELKKNAKK